MNVSNINSATTTQQTTSTNDGFGQALSDFKNIASAIESGDLSSAQSALTSFENDLQSGSSNNPLSQLFSNNSTLSTDLSNLQSALSSGSTSSAQSAFGSLISDLQNTMQSHRTHRRRHHHVEQASDGDSDDASQTATSATSANSSSSSASSAGSTSGVTPTVGSTLNVQA